MRAFILLLLAAGAFAADSTRIWDAAPHSAFTDLIRHKGQWLCVFREGKAHVSTDGSIRVIVSKDGVKWTSLAHITQPGVDLRDPKVTHTPKGELMITAAAAHRERDGQSPVPHDSQVWFSKDGKTWSAPEKIGDPNFWLWRATWNRNRVYMVGYETMRRDGATRLYSSGDGKQFEAHVPVLVKEGFPNESTIIFRKDGTALCLMRRDSPGANGLIGSAKAPFKEWDWKPVGARVGGPNFVELPGGRLIGVVRLYDGKTRTAVVEIDAGGGIKELQTLPSSGDSSYAGLVWHKGELWISYYSSHEGKTAIYLAKWKP